MSSQFRNTSSKRKSQHPTQENTINTSHNLVVETCTTTATTVSFENQNDSVSSKKQKLPSIDELFTFVKKEQNKAFYRCSKCSIDTEVRLKIAVSLSLTLCFTLFSFLNRR
jgi:hypothetical protein